MKIAFVSDHASPWAVPSGSERQNSDVAELARQLVRLGHSVDVFTRRDRPLLPFFAGLDGARVIHVPAGPPISLPRAQLLPHMREFADFLVDFCQQETVPYDVLHANSFTSGLVGLWVKEALGIPLVMSFHELAGRPGRYPNADDDVSGSRGEIEEALAWKADAIVVDGPDAEAGLRARYGAESSRIGVVPRGYDAGQEPGVDRETARGLLGWPRARFAVLHAGALLPGDGVGTIVRSIGVLRDRHHQDAHLYIVGSTTRTPDQDAAKEAMRLRAIARECGLAERVTFVGRCTRDELRPFYGAADVFVTAARSEPRDGPRFDARTCDPLPFDVMPLEAMACRTPVIAADLAEIRPTIRHGETGLLVPPHDPVALAGWLCALKTDPVLARRLGAAGQARARAQPTWPDVARALAEIYGRAARRPPAQTASSRANRRPAIQSQHAIGG